MPRTPAAALAFAAVLARPIMYPITTRRGSAARGFGPFCRRRRSRPRVRPRIASRRNLSRRNEHHGRKIPLRSRSQVDACLMRRMPITDSHVAPSSVKNKSAAKTAADARTRPRPSHLSPPAPPAHGGTARRPLAATSCTVHLLLGHRRRPPRHPPPPHRPESAAPLMWLARRRRVLTPACVSHLARRYRPER